MRTRNQRGFSLLEMIIVVALLLVVSAIVFETMNNVRRKATVEKGGVEGLQDARNVVDLIVRDLHNSGFPNYKQYKQAVLTPMAVQSVAEGTSTVSYYEDARVAFGIISVTDTTLVLEGDVNNDGSVEQVKYKIAHDPTFNGVSAGQCPCVLERNIVTKLTGNTAGNTPEANNWDVMVGGIINSGAAPRTIYGSATSQTGITMQNDTQYAAYKTMPIFSAVTDSSGKPIAITINLAVLGQTPDQQTGLYPVATLSATSRVYQPQ